MKSQISDVKKTKVLITADFIIDLYLEAQQMPKAKKAQMLEQCKTLSSHLGEVFNILPE